MTARLLSAPRRLGRRIGWLYPAVLAAAFLAALAAGYVYSHDPAPDRVVLSLDREQPASDRVLSGTVTEVADGTLTLDSGSETIEIALATDTPVDELRRVSDPFEAGTEVNVGVEQTEFGLVLTGIVAVEAGP